MLDVNKFNQRFNHFLNPETGFWSSSKMIHKMKGLEPRYVNYPPSLLKQRFNELPAYQRHKEVRKSKNQSNSIQIHNIGSFQVDLADFTSFNHPEYKWLLVIIDVFSRFLIAYPLQTKSNNELIPKMEEFITRWNNGEYVRKALSLKNENKPVKNLSSRQSKEEIEDDSDEEENNNQNNQNNVENNTEERYRNEKQNEEFKDKVFAISGDSDFTINAEFEALCNHYKITLYPSPPNQHSGRTSIVDRVIRTIRGMLGRYFTANNTSDWVSVIDALVNNYNDTKHRTIGVPPRWALAHKDKSQKGDPKYIKSLKNNKKNKIDTLKVGDWVRIRYSGRNKFHTKQNLPYWSQEIYVIMKKVRNRFIISYKGDEIKGANGRQKTYAPQDLLKISKHSSIKPSENPSENQSENIDKESNDIDIQTNNNNNRNDIQLNIQQTRKQNRIKSKMNKELEIGLKNPLPKEKIRTIIEPKRYNPEEELQREKQMRPKKRKNKTKLDPLLPTNAPPLLQIHPPRRLHRQISDNITDSIYDYTEFPVPNFMNFLPFNLNFNNTDLNIPSNSMNLPNL